MQAKQPKIAYTGRVFLFRPGPVPQAVCFLPHPCVGPLPLERESERLELEPDPVQYVPAWHRLQETEEVAPANMQSDAECTRLKG